MTAFVLLSGGSAIGWMVIMTFVVLITGTYYGIKSMISKNHTIEGPIPTVIETTYDTKVNINLYKEKYGEKIVLSVVSEKEIARFQMAKVVENLTHEQNYDIKFYRNYRFGSPYASYTDGKLTFANDK